MTVEPLAWDSEFFGYSVGRFQVGDGQFDPERLQTAASSMKLVYVTSRNPISSELLTCGDSKLVFGRVPQGHARTPNVESCPARFMEELKQIGLQSGLWSRYALDPRFRDREFERLYEKWVERSVNREIAYDCLTVMGNGAPTGILTLSDDGSDASAIGIFAVSEQFRGMGIGKQLLTAADTISFNRGDKFLSVATQGKNRAACDVYRKFGFEVVSETFIYHFWNPIL